MGTVTVDQAKLVMNTFCAIFEDNLVTGDAVSWNEHSGELDDTNKLQVVEQIGPRYKVTRTQNGVKDLTAGTDGSAFGSEIFTIDGTFNANMGWGDFVKIRDIGAARQSKALIGAATSMAEQIDAYILGISGLASYDWTGTVGNPLVAEVDVVAAYTRLKEQGVSDNDLKFILNWTDRQGLGDQVVKLPNNNDATRTYREGFTSSINGVDTAFTNSLPSLTTGTRAATAEALINGAAQNVNYAAACISAANGQFMTQTLILDTFTAGHTVVAGEVFTIPGVFAYDCRKQAAVIPARLQQFTVVTGGAADGGGNLTIRIAPAMVVPGSGAGDNININTAHATVSAAPADNAVITWLGAASTTIGPRLLIQKDAINVDTIPLIMPATGIAMRKKLDRIPVTVRMWQWSDFYTGAHSVRFDVAMNANIRARNRTCRFNGA